MYKSDKGPIETLTDLCDSVVGTLKNLIDPNTIYHSSCRTEEVIKHLIERIEQTKIGVLQEYE